MGWLRRLRLERAARQYAAELPARLWRGFGAAEIYKPEQIRATARAAGLDMTFIALGYAAYLPEQEYASLWLHMPRSFGYDEARAAFRRHLPRNASARPPDSTFIAGGGDPAHTH